MLNKIYIYLLDTILKRYLSTLSTKTVKTMCGIVAVGGVTVLCNLMFFHTMHLPKFSQISKLDAVRAEIDYIAIECGEGVFIGWEILEKRCNDVFCINFDYEMSFNILRGSMLPRQLPTSIKHKNPLYLKKHIIDSNTLNKFQALQEGSIMYVTPEIITTEKLYVLQNINNNLNIKKYNLELDKIYFTIVKKNKNIIWVFSMSFVDEQKAKCYASYPDLRQNMIISLAKRAKEIYSM